jgi:Transaldolase/Fructose-6-phosphate aldolase
MPESGENQCLNGIARHFPALGILPQMPNSAFATKSLARIIARDILDSRTPTRYIDELLVTGLTSNPTIFDHAIRNSTHYDAAILEKLAQGESPISRRKVTLGKAMHEGAGH